MPYVKSDLFQLLRGECPTFFAETLDSLRAGIGRIRSSLKQNVEHISTACNIPQVYTSQEAFLITTTTQTGILGIPVLSLPEALHE